LVLSSATCLSIAEKTALEKFLNDGGLVIATGPTGQYDERANPVSKTWLGNFGVHVEVIEPARPGGFPPYSCPKPVALAQCRAPETPALRNGWLELSAGSGTLYWRPGRMSEPATARAVTELLSAGNSSTLRLEGLPAGWRLREYREGQRLLIHALPGQVETVISATLKNHLSGEHIVEKLKFTPLTRKLLLKPQSSFAKVTLYSPDLAASREARPAGGLNWSINPSGISRYFVIECQT
jgi:hypothetical protein